MSTAAPMPDAELERRIAEQRELAELAMWDAERQSDPQERRRCEDRARGHYQMMAGLISRRTDRRAGGGHG